MSDESKQHIRWFRSSAPYINAHRGRTFVLMLGGEAARHGGFANIAHDIALLSSLGVRLILLLGTRGRIAERLRRAKIAPVLHGGVRVTSAEALEHAVDAAGNARAQLEALLSMGLPNSPMHGAGLRVLSGNFITARPMGVVDGVDFQHTGRVRRIDAAGIRQGLDAGAIVLLSPLGYSPTGEVFNLALEDIAVHTAAAVGADKLLLFGEAKGICNAAGELVRQCDLPEARALLADMNNAESEPARLLQTAIDACRAGVPRCQIISYAEDCALLEELFTHDGNGTLVASADFEQARAAVIEDAGGILELIEPLEREGVLVKRSRELLETEIGHFRVLERDQRILACAALYPFAGERCGEIACIVTHPDYRGGRRGARLLRELEKEARRLGLERLFVLTTQTSHWFLEQGFAEAGRDALPGERQRLYNLQRNSKVLLKNL